MKKKPNPQDATRRNVQAANKKIAKLEARVTAIEQKLSMQHAPSEPEGPPK